MVKNFWSPLFSMHESVAPQLLSVLPMSVVEKGATATPFVNGEWDRTMEAGGQVANARGTLTVPLSLAYTLVTPGLCAITNP
jgi:hypothetical protein